MKMALPHWLATDVLPITIAARQKEQLAAFNTAGLPSRKNERFKYTDFTALTLKSYSQPTVNVSEQVNALLKSRPLAANTTRLVLVNGSYQAELSTISHSEIAVTALINNPDLPLFNAESYPFAALNAALSTTAMVVKIPAGLKEKVQLQLLHIADAGNTFIAQPQLFIQVGSESHLEWVDEYVSTQPNAYCMNVLTQVNLANDAQLTLYKLQTENALATHIATTFIHQEKNSQATITQFGFGASFARDDVVVELLAEGAACLSAGYYRLREPKQYIDYHLDIQHKAPRTKSEMLYKGVLDVPSRAVFNGRLYVGKDAQKILAYQANHHLLLTPNAEIYSKPELEIYADDVKCKHGASTGQIDPDTLFFLRSRGISVSEAYSMVVRGFGEEILNRVEDSTLRTRIEEML